MVRRLIWTLNLEWIAALQLSMLTASAVLHSNETLVKMASDSEATPFLKEYDAENNTTTPKSHTLRERWRIGSILAKSICSIVILTVYTLAVACAAITLDNSSAHPNNGTSSLSTLIQRYITDHSIALRNPHIRYHTNKTITAGMSPFAGGPSEKVDDAWRDLMSSISVRVSQEELDHNGNHQESVSLPEGGGNLVWLNVFHQLHCLVCRFLPRDHELGR
jgi:hypothetical protein